MWEWSITLNRSEAAASNHTFWMNYKQVSQQKYQTHHDVNKITFRPLSIHWTLILKSNKCFPDDPNQLWTWNIGIWMTSHKNVQNEINSIQINYIREPMGFEPMLNECQFYWKKKLWKEPIETTEPGAQTVVLWFLSVKYQNFFKTIYKRMIIQGIEPLWQILDCQTIWLSAKCEKKWKKMFRTDFLWRIRFSFRCCTHLKRSQ